MTDKKEMPSLQVGGRELFERSMLSSGDYYHSDLKKNDRGDYVNPEVDNVWRGWELRNDVAMVRANVPTMPGPVPVDASTAGWLAALADAFHALKKAGPDRAHTAQKITDILRWMAQPAHKRDMVPAEDVQAMLDATRIEAAHLVSNCSEESSCQRAAESVVRRIGKPVHVEDMEHALSDLKSGLEMMARRALAEANTPDPVADMLESDTNEETSSSPRG